MKKLVSLIALIFATQAMAIAPIGVRGQNQTSIYPSVHQVPNYQATDVGSSSVLLETGNKNILANPSFENPTTAGAVPSWSFGGTGNPTAETTKIISGKTAVTITATAQSIHLYQNSTLYVSALDDGLQGLAMAWVWSDVVDIYLCARINNTIIATTDGTKITNCVQHPGNSSWALLKLPTIFGATDNGVSVISLNPTTAALKTITSAAGVTVDDAFMGAVDLKTDSVQIQTQTTKFTAGSTGVGVIFTGTPTTVGSGNYTVASGTFTALRDINVVMSCTGTNSSAGAQATYIYVNNTFTGQGSGPPQITNYLGAVTWSGIVPAGQTFYCASAVGTASAGQVNVMATNTTNTQLYSASCGANCVDKFSAVIAATTGVVSGENSDFIAGNCVRSSTNNFIVTCTTTASTTSLFTVTPNCTCSANIAGAGRGCVVNSANTKDTLTFYTSDSSGVAADVQLTVSCEKTGADFSASRTLVASLAEVMTAPNVSKPKTCYYSFGGASATLASPTECTTGTCVEVYDSCGAGTPPTWATTALYNNTTFASGTWANSTPVHCSCVAYDVTSSAIRACYNYFVTSANTWSSSASGGLVLNSVASDPAGTGQTAYVQIKCEGQAP